MTPALWHYAVAMTKSAAGTETITLKVGELRIETDAEGYLLNRHDWSPAVAEALATRENIALTPAHWELIELVQRYYQQFEHAPAMRPLVKFVGKELGADKGRSIYLMQLFPGSSAKLLARISGLPRPDHCL